MDELQDALGADLGDVQVVRLPSNLLEGVDEKFRVGECPVVQVNNSAS